jgi:hypothetical protein
MAAPDRRTTLVLVVLVAAMTLASGILLVLEPRPVGAGDPIVLSVLDRPAGGASLFDTTPAPRPNAWTTIIIQNSGAPAGSADTLGKTHEKIGLGGLGYHFVIGNGSGAPDGQIVAGFRWTRQVRGAFPGGALDPPGRRTLSICLIGDGNHPPTDAQLRQLVWLVRQLQGRFHIPADHILTPRLDPRTGRGIAFPTAAFRQQLY